MMISLQPCREFFWLPSVGYTCNYAWFILSIHMHFFNIEIFHEYQPSVSKLCIFTLIKYNHITSVGWTMTYCNAIIKRVWYIMYNNGMTLTDQLNLMHIMIQCYAFLSMCMGLSYEHLTIFLIALGSLPLDGPAWIWPAPSSRRSCPSTTCMRKTSSSR